MRVEEWFAEHIPDRWGARAVEVLADPDEILVILELAAKRSSSADPPSAEEVATRFRDATREERMALAAAAESLFATRISWGVRHGPEVVLFTTATVPVMTRLRLPERRVLDTLIDAGLARTRSEALAWCVRLVGEHEKEWLEELRAAFQAVEEVRRKGPQSRRR
ncbi:MAG TPA: hypothetical protein VFH58_07025 [Acidimicrobiales bacterium]|nr:hypothetical protein [Acidimicrobiales bacterium]